MKTTAFLFLQLIVLTVFAQNTIKGDNTVCEGTKATYSYSIADKNVKFKDWVLPEGAEKLTESKNKITLQFAKNGTYELQANFISDDNVLSSKTFKVEVMAQPKLNIAGLDRVYAKSDNIFEANSNSEGDVIKWSVYYTQGGVDLLHGSLGFNAKNDENVVMFSYPSKKAILLNFRRAGVYEIQVSSKNKNGCISSTQKKMIKAYLGEANPELTSNMP